MASSLCVSVTPHTSADKVEYAKRKLLESTQQHNTSGTHRSLYYVVILYLPKNKRMRLYSKDRFPITRCTINVYEAV